jgi:ATP-dependent Clp protease protease subunit
MDMESNNPYSDIFNKMLLNRILFLSGEINLYTSEVIKSQILYLESLDKEEDITIYINSPGGSVYDGLGILDIMEYVKPDIITINTGLAASMAAIILCSGTKGKRKALKRSRTMIHQPLLYGADIQQASDMEIEAKEINLLKKELCEIISEKTNQKYSKVLKDSDRNYWLSAKDALEYGIIDKIIK